nr:hypothetical protein Ade03nite_33720 [Actinoplanes derwentensis]
MIVRDRAGTRQVPQPGDQHEVLPPGEDLVDRRELPGQADRRPDVGGLPGHVETVDHSGPGIRPQQGGQDPDEGGLTRPVRPEQSEDAATRDVEVHTTQDLHFIERFPYAANPDHSRG